jgi:hypothetical protein
MVVVVMSVMMFMVMTMMMAMPTLTIPIPTIILLLWRRISSSIVLLRRRPLLLSTTKQPTEHPTALLSIVLLLLSMMSRKLILQLIRQHRARDRPRRSLDESAPAVPVREHAAARGARQTAQQAALTVGVVRVIWIAAAAGEVRVRTCWPGGAGVG